MTIQIPVLDVKLLETVIWPTFSGPSILEIGAGEGIRTLDPNLGKVVLYH